MGAYKFQFIGNLTCDVDVRYKSNGQAFAVFDLALANEWQDNSSQIYFVRIKTSDKTAENAGKYLGKGSLVYVQGRIENTKYERDGETGYAMDFIADSVQRLHTKVLGRQLDPRPGDNDKSFG